VFRRALGFVLPAFLAVSLVACDDASRPKVSSGTAAPDTAAPDPAGLTLADLPEGTSLVATARVPSVPIYDAPDAPEPSREIQPTVYETADGPVQVPLVFLVKAQEEGWLEVYLPVRPNGSTGWVRESDVTLTANPYRIVVDVTNHEITAFEDNGELLRGPIGVGTEDTPTPGGIYYIKELLQPPDPTTVYGPYAYGLSGFSDVLESFNGGEGVIGIHGNNDETSLGNDVSAGCIRMDNDQITQLVEEPLPLGTPVEIIA
jgi:lipoprotein-anchoring transpeptidase ErfK/SrfK